MLLYSYIQELIQGVDGEAIATHHELYSFIIFSQNYFQIQSLKDKLSIFSWGHVPRLPSKIIL